uniref:FAD dependent oxidoreductase n=1 Tax=Rhodopseudomonas palustris (strain BisA53) TaxID=316055 RepID=Q07RI5_RHOP5
MPETAPPDFPQLRFDLDVDVCVVGAGLAGLTVARELALGGLSVAVLEGRQVGWSASGHQLGTVMPGFGVPPSELIERLGLHDASDLWALSKYGALYVRATAALIPGLTLSEGALEVSTIEGGDRLIERLQLLGHEFGTEVEGWQIDQVRAALRTERYFHAVHYPTAFQLDGRRYLHGLAELAVQAGARIYEGTPVVSIDPEGIRKRIVTPQARLRASHIVLAGNVHLGATLQRLTDTLLPVWRYAGLTAPLGDKLSEAIGFAGSVADSDGIDHFRIVGGDRLLWSSPETSFAADPARFSGAIARRIRIVFPQLGAVAIERSFAGVIGQTVHGMPQIGQLQRGLWVASGFGRQGLNTSAMAGKLIAQGILTGDTRWKLFSPFELVWAGGRIGRVAGQAIHFVARGHAAAQGALARYHERARARERAREARREAARASALSMRQEPRLEMPADQEAAEAAPPDRDQIARDNVSQNQR